MIDLSHLTEEEQGVIMSVLRRDLELKKAEEERISKLEKILHSGSQSDTEMKYLTGEWFYEAKSRRHMDKIHGSEIILASMKQRKAALDGSLRIERSKAPSSRGSDIVGPPKPARCLESLQPPEFNDAEKENLNSGLRSPRTPRHNPFNRASLTVVEPPENNDDMSASRDRELSETELLSPLKSHPAGEVSQTSGGSVTSETSSVGFRPVPKKRTFLSRCTSSQSGSNGVGSDTQVSSNSSLERERNPHSLPRARPATYSRFDASSDRQTTQKSDERHEEQQREQAAVNTVFLHTSSIQDSDRQNSVGTAMKQEELSLPQSTVDPDPPVSYDLNIVDKSDQQTQKKMDHRHMFKLSTQTTSPTGDEDAIAKVLDWFSRSTDSSEWLDTEDAPEATKSSEKHVEISKLRGEDSLSKDAGDIISDRKKETLEGERSHTQKQTSEVKELRVKDRIGNKELTETQEEVMKDTGERMRSQEFEDHHDVSQPPQISHLKTFWEKSNMGPKILISKSITPSNKGQKPAHPSAEKDEKLNKPHRVSDMPSVPEIYNGKGSYDKYTSNHGDEREEQLLISPQKDTGDVHLHSNQEIYNLVMNTSTVDPQVFDRRGSDTEILNISRLSPQTQTAIQSRLSPESERVPLVKPNPQPDSISQTRESPLQDELSKTVLESQLNRDLETKHSSDSEKVYLSRNSPYMDYMQDGVDIQITPKTRMHSGSSEDVKRRDTEDKSMQSSMSPKRKEDMSTKDRINSPHSNRQGLPHQESTAEKIKQLRSFWEQERSKPMFYTGKPKALGDGKVARGANQAKLSKRFTKSEYDLSSIGNYSGSDEEDSGRSYQNFTILPLNQRLDKLSTSLGTSRTQFNTLREFWDEATSDTKGSFDKSKSPKRKEPLSAQPSSQELKCGDPEIYREKTRPAVMKSSPPPQNRSKSPLDRQSGSRASNDSKNNMSNFSTAEQQREPKRSSKDSNREEKSTKPPSSSGKETRSPKSRKDSPGNSSSRVNSMRRTTSMFALTAPDEKDQSQLKMDISHVLSQSRKQRQSTEKSPMPRRSSEETEPLTPRARACVPRDYRHYLGMTDETSIHTSLAPALQDEGSEGQSGYEFDLGGPVRASTPVSSEERYSRKGNKTSQRPLWTNYSSSDTVGENDDEHQSPVWKALRRAEARPKNLAKSMEDITASISPRQERRQDPTVDMRRISDVSSIPSPSSSLFSDPGHLKKMSKSVPSFLQKEVKPPLHLLVQ